MLGVVIGIGITMKFAYSSFGIYPAIILFCILLFGWLAVRYGDRFWEVIAKWWGWY